MRRGGRVAEGNGLLNRRRGKTSTEGSNPSLSAKLDFAGQFCNSANFRAEVAQLVEHSPEKAGVDSSILSLGTTFPTLTDCSR
jgi:hypothetical protein